MTHKNETPEPKKASPKKLVKKKVVKPASSQRVADIGDSEGNFPTVTTISHTITPATVTTTTEQEHKAPNIEDLHAEFGVHEVEEEVKERATGVWTKVKEWWAKYGWIPVVAVSLIAVIFGYLYFARDKRDKSVKQTQQAEQKIEDGKARLEQTENNLQDLQHRKVDSNYRAALQSIFEQLRKASDQYEAYHAQMIERNELYKTKNDELQKRIATANDDSLLRIGRELSK
jgi:hypothetical protein